MLRRLLTTILVAGLVSVMAIPATAHQYTVGSLKIGHPWSLPTPPGAPTAAGYLTITNVGAAPDRFLGGETPLAVRFEIHRMTMDGGIMRMRPIVGGLPVEPGKTLRFDPSGYHLMLIGLKRPLKVGDDIPATLRFARAGGVKVEFHVQARAPKGGADAMDMR
ncbi:MAG TPA: copper chaperone PCu(A)C [Caulobacteraceae bacterium]|nr:copper chaperone PCu(A)C [Caulobacteraceae bacterium]